MTRIQVPRDYYLNKKYASLERFISYFYQIDAIRKLQAHSILFIGVGDGLVANLLKKSCRVMTMDIDPDLNPDIVGDIRSLPFADKEFDIVCAFEVLEHIPLDDARLALKEMNRVSKSAILISVPHRRSGFEVVFKFPFIRTIFRKDFIRLALLLPVRFPGFAISKQHYWEIDGWSLSLRHFRNLLKLHFCIISEKTPCLDPYRRFFHLEKKVI